MNGYCVDPMNDTDRATEPAPPPSLCTSSPHAWKRAWRYWGRPPIRCSVSEFRAELAIVLGVQPRDVAYSLERYYEGEPIVEVHVGRQEAEKLDRWLHNCYRLRIEYRDAGSGDRMRVVRNYSREGLQAARSQAIERGEISTILAYDKTMDAYDAHPVEGNPTHGEGAANNAMRYVIRAARRVANVPFVEDVPQHLIGDVFDLAIAFADGVIR